MSENPGQTVKKPSVATVMVIDDETAMLTLNGIMLERGGFKVLKASGAHQALELLEGESPDMIIMDAMMPGITGVELCRMLRERPDTKETPILMLSARSDDEMIQRGKDAGVDDYFPKPVLHNDLIAKVRSMLKIVG